MHYLLGRYPDVPAVSPVKARFPVFTRLAAVKHVLRDIFHSVTIGAIRIMKI